MMISYFIMKQFDETTYKSLESYKIPEKSESLVINQNKVIEHRVSSTVVFYVNQLWDAIR